MSGESCLRICILKFQGFEACLWRKPAVVKVLNSRHFDCQTFGNVDSRLLFGCAEPALWQHKFPILAEKGSRPSVSMARPPRVLSLLCRLGALRSTIAPVSVSSRGFASRGASREGSGQSRVSHRASGYSDEVSDGDPALEDVEDKLQALVDEGRKRQRTVKYHILRRQMTPPGAPQRKLTWDAIEQIRYLKQEQPDEWTVESLAEGFSVTPDVIRRVLRSKFVPVPERKAKQDAKIMAELSQQMLPSGAGKDRLKLHGNPTPPVLTPGSRESAVVPVADRALVFRGEGSGALAKSAVPVPAVPTQDAQVTSPAGEDVAANRNPTEKDEDSWDGQVLTDKEIEEFIEMEKPGPMVQVGNEFFDAEGNFLYRI